MHSLDILNDGTETRYACNASREGAFVLRNGAYSQLAGTCQTPRFASPQQFRRWLSRRGIRGRTVGTHWY